MKTGEKCTVSVTDGTADQHDFRPCVQHMICRVCGGYKCVVPGCNVASDWTRAVGYCEEHSPDHDRHAHQVAHKPKRNDYGEIISDPTGTA